MLQATAAPGNPRIKIISTNSPHLLSFIKNLSPDIYKAASKMAAAEGEGGELSAEDIADYYKNNHPPFAGIAYSFKKPATVWGSPAEVVCMANTYENYDQIVQTAGDGSQYILRAQGLSGVVYQPLHEARTEVLVHELQHCMSDSLGITKQSQAAMGDEAGALYATAVEEMFSDLAVVLYMASKEGSFDNAMAAMRATRGTAFLDAEHNTEDMLEYVVDQLHAEDFRGLAVSEIYDYVNSLSRKLEPALNADMRNAFAKSTVEKAMLADRIFTAPKVRQNNQERFAVAQHQSQLATQRIATVPLQIDVKGRGERIINDLIINNLRAKELHRSLGVQTEQSLGEFAALVGTRLRPDQLARIAVFDPKYSPPGSKNTSPVPGDERLASINHFDDLARAMPQVDGAPHRKISQTRLR